MVVYIYALCHPVTKRTAYVGRSRRPRERRDAHWSNPHSRLKEWIAELRSEGVKPDLVLLDKGSEEESVFKEQEWIARLRAEGEQLLNAPRMGRLPREGPEAPCYVRVGMSSEFFDGVRQEAVRRRVTVQALVLTALEELMARAKGLK